METYEAELLRSAIPNWFLAKATADAGVKMVLTGEGADELWAGYAYFEDSPGPAATQFGFVSFISSAPHKKYVNVVKTVIHAENLKPGMRNTPS